ncbi:hypothetical protein Hanom_Chr14g01291981 [Helianthus anomalus]
MGSKTGKSYSSASASSDALFCKWGVVSYNNLVQDYGIRAEWKPVLPFCNFRLPITKFCKLVVDHYRVHISQLHPLGLVKLLQFEFAYTDVSCLRDIPTSSKDKDWKMKFFYIDACVIPGEMHWRDVGPKYMVKDDSPSEDAYISNALYTRLCDRPFECTVIPEGALVMAGMSLLWRDIK